MQNYRRIVAALLTSTILATAAFAQDDNASNTSSFEEDVIIVEATRRASDIQDIPIAVTAITPKQLERQGITSIKDLASVAPGFNIQSSQTETQGTSIRIRGVGTTGNNIGLESAVGIFIDGVYQSRPGIALGELVDVEAIEMLRGPQGTLFGRNVTAGALIIRTKKPEMDQTGGFANLTYGNYNMVNLQGGVNIPASENLAFRATGSFHQRDGFLTSSVDPDAESHNRNRLVLRGQALWEPTDQTSLRLVADYQDVDENCCAAVTLSASPNLTTAQRDARFPVLGFEDSLEAQIFNDQEFINNVESYNFSAELNHDFGGATGTVILSYSNFLGNSVQQDFNAGQQYSVGGLTVPAQDRMSFDDIQTFTAEARLQGEAMDGRLDWLVGGFYAQEDIVEEFTLGLGADYSALVGSANFPIGPVSSSFLSLYAGAGAFIQQLQLGNPDPTFAPLSANGQYARNRFEQDAESFSVFTHNIFSVTDTVNLTLGARYVDDTKNGSYDQVAVGGNGCLAAATFLATLSAAGAGDPASGAAISALGAAIGPATLGLLTNPALIGGGGFLNCFPFASPAIGSGFIPDAFASLPFIPQEFADTFSDDELVYTAKLSWEPNADLLIFGGFTHGYKAGGFNLDASAAQAGADPRFASELIDAWEFGFKKTLADGRFRFNVTGFHQTMDDFQVLEFTGTQFQTFNVDDVSSKGVEVELNGRLSEAVFINSGVTYANANYGEDCNRGGTIAPATPLCDNILTNAPKWSSVLGITYDGDFLDTDWGFLANVNMNYQSKRRTSTNPSTVVGGAVVPVDFDYQDGIAKFNARVGFTMPNDLVSIEFWGLNLTDEITRGITFNTAVQGASRSAFLEPPRQYGVTLRTQF